MLVGSTDRPGPAQAFDRVDDEELAVEMVRVIERLRPATWATILPVTLPAGMETRSHPELVEEAQREYDNRGHEARTQAAEVKAEALRRLGRLDDAVPVLELEPPQERHRRQRTFRRRRSERAAAFHTEQPVEAAGEQPVEPEVVPVVEERQPSVMPVPALHVAEVADVGEPPTVELEPPPEHGRRRQRSFRLRSSERQHEGQSDEPVEEPEVAPAVEEAPRSGTPVPALLVAARPEEPEPAATATTGEEPEPPRERGRRRRRSFRIRSSERQTDRQGDEPVKATEAMPIVEQVPSVAAVTALAGAEAHGEGEPAAATTPVDGATEFTERIAGYAFAYQRRSGADRRSGGDRRKTQVEGFEESLDRRAGGERRSGLNRRRTIA